MNGKPLIGRIGIGGRSYPLKKVTVAIVDDLVNSKAHPAERLLPSIDDLGDSNSLRSGNGTYYPSYYDYAVCRRSTQQITVELRDTPPTRRQKRRGRHRS